MPTQPPEPRSKEENIKRIPCRQCTTPTMPTSLWLLPRFAKGHSAQSQSSRSVLRANQDKSSCLICLTSKISHGGRWRRACFSTICDIYRSWLHRVVRLLSFSKIPSAEDLNTLSRETPIEQTSKIFLQLKQEGK